MPLNKRIFLSLIVSFFLTISLSGCIFQDIFGGGLNIDSWTVVDSNGFPAISYSYSCSNYILVKMFNPDDNLVDTDYFFKGDGKKTLYLGSYKQTIALGKYTIKAYNSNGNEVTSKSLSFNENDILISSCDQKWWVKGSDKILVGLNLVLSNIGDTSVYPYSISLETESESISGLVLPCNILPGDSSIVNCVLYKNSVPSEDIFNLYDFDIDGNILSSKQFDFDIKNSMQTETYNKGVEKTLYLPYPDFLFEYYSSLERINENDYSYYVFDNYDDYFLDLFIDKMVSTLSFGELQYNKMSETEKINFFANFVQNLEYKEDIVVNNQSEYPNYPIESFFKRIIGCDCEDKSILMASILDRVGFNVSLFRLPNHMAVGVKLDDVEGYSKYNNGYYYLETTTIEAPIGFIPSQYRNPSSLEVYELSNRPFITQTWIDGVFTIYTQTSFGDFVKLDAIIENYGRSTATDIKLKGVFVTSFDTIINSEEYTISSLEPSKKTKVTLTVDIPKTLTTTFKSLVYLNDEIVNEKESVSTFP